MGETGKRYRSFKPHNGDEKNQKRRVDRDNRGDDEVVAYRILCPDTVIGNVIGKSGKVINAIRQDTRAKVKVVDPFPGAKERVITIYCFVKEKLDFEVDGEFNDMEPLCPAQDALMRTHAAIMNALASFSESDKGQRDREECSILVPASQSANVIGKSGAVIKKLRSKTRANIKVIAKDLSDPTHSCALDFDNFVQITGDPDSVKKALFAVSAIIYKFAPKEQIPLDTAVPEGLPNIIIPADMPIYPSGDFYGGGDPIVSSRSGVPLLDVPPREIPHPGYSDAGRMWARAVPGYSEVSRSEELSVRVLCPADIIGRVIGKGGSTIKSVRQTSGAYIDVDDTKATKDKFNNECLITITSTESSEDVQSRAVEAVLLLQEKMSEEAEFAVFKLLVASKNIGCIIGKSGSIINEIRKRSRADIRISKVENTRSADYWDEYVEVSGDVKNVRDALIQIVLRLRDDALKDKDGSNKHPIGTESLYPGGSGLSVPPVLSTVPPLTPRGYEHRSEAGAGMLSSGGRYKYGSLGIGDDAYGSPYSSKLYGGPLPSSTFEILIPAYAVSNVLGKNGANIANIRQLSGAVIEISESKSSRGECLAHISGTSEQKHTAENLIKAFIMAA